MDITAIQKSIACLKNTNEDKRGCITPKLFYIMMRNRKKHRMPRRWVVTIGSLRFNTRGVRYGAKRRAEEEAENLFYLAYWDDEHPERQVELFSESLALNPRDGIVYLNRGIAYDALGDMERALADFEQAIRLCPKRAETYNNRGYLRYRQGQYELAIPDFDRAIKLNPDYAQAYCSRGSAYGMLGNHEQAMDDIEKAIEIDPDFLLAYVNRAAYYLNMDRVSEAEEELKYVLERDPDDSIRALAEKYRGLCMEYRNNHPVDSDRNQ